MTRKQRRIAAVCIVLLGAGVAVGLSLYALRDNVTFFYSPSDILNENPKVTDRSKAFRLGGLVKQGSITREGMNINFTVTDNKNEIIVHYTGVPPDLFKEGQGVVATGKLEADNSFTATNLLAKHDEKYMPPEVARALQKTAQDKGHPAPEGSTTP